MTIGGFIGSHLLLTLIILCRNEFALSKYVPPQPTEELDWWQTSIFYHLYPRSFKDSNGDGVGDIKGMIEKLPEHLKDMGVGAVWLSPFFKSPMADFGYDISDFRSIEPVFGDLNDFNTLKDKLHEVGIKLLLDFVPNHTSDEHEWFQKSVANIPPYDKFYIWKDPKGYNGTQPIPPNNWRSEFSGSGWTFSPQRNQFYLHQFLKKQPDLDFRNPELVQALKDILIFWLENGVDGFRIDSMPFLFEDSQFRDEPYVNPNITDDPKQTSLIHIYTRNQPEIYDIVKQWSELVEEYSKKDSKTRFIFLEAYTSINYTMEYYNYGDDLMPFNFFLITDLNGTSNAKDFNSVIHLWIENMPKGKWPNWVLGNHDRPRVSARFGNELVDGFHMLTLLLPGTPVVYYGEEIGMQDTYIKWSETVDPFGLNFGPEQYSTVSRDPARTPFQWDESISSGFSTNKKTWLPVNPNFYYLNLKNQKSAEISHYQIFKRLSKLRTEKVFRYGELETYALSENVFAFKRFLNGEPTYIVLINLGSSEESFSVQKVLPETKLVYVHTISMNSDHRIGDDVVLSNDFSMRPKSSIVFSTSNKRSERSLNVSPVNSSSGCFYSSLVLLMSVLFLTFI